MIILIIFEIEQRDACIVYETIKPTYSSFTLKDVIKKDI